jgi:hypothetical protein
MNGECNTATAFVNGIPQINRKPKVSLGFRRVVRANPAVSKRPLIGTVGIRMTQRRRLLQEQETRKRIPCNASLTPEQFPALPVQFTEQPLYSSINSYPELFMSRISETKPSLRH